MGYENITVPFRDWNVVREIGSGSFGKVFEIRRDRYGIVERSAMKVIAVPQDPNEIRTFLRDGYAPETLRKMYDGSRASVLEEYQTMIKLKDCPNIVRCEDIEIVMDPDGIGSKIYIRMELLTPMREYDKMRSFNEAEVIKLGSDICNMLVRCEAEGVVHRDIKPGNIMVSGQGDYKLGDFGIARSMDQSTITTRIGTMNYIAPEVYNGKKYGHAADIYSLGLVIYWLLNNRRMPFFPQNDSEINSSSAATAQQLRMMGKPIPRPVNGGTGIAGAVLKALAYDPGDRYQSAMEFGNEIRRCLPSERLSERLSGSENEITERLIIKDNDKTDRFPQDPVNVQMKTQPLYKEEDRRMHFKGETDIKGNAERRFRETKKEADGYKPDLTANENISAAKIKERATKRPAQKKRYLGGIIFAACALLVLLCVLFVMKFVKNGKIFPNLAGNGKDSAALPTDEKVESGQESAVEKISIGDTYIFGSYEQDDNAQDGTEAIEWIVLDKSENEQKILLISKYALDGKKFEGESSKATWDTCSLRSWLNYDFYNQAFSEKERNRIKETTVKAEWNREFDVNPGKDTLNKVFLLSRKEAEMYFSGQSARRCRCTYYGYTADVAQNEGEDACNWWLRSPGKSEREVAYINYNGEFGSKEVYAHLAVRPAIWISIESIISEDSPESGESPLDSRVDSNPLDDIFFGTGN